jgi:transposase
MKMLEHKGCLAPGACEGDDWHSIPADSLQCPMQRGVCTQRWVTLTEHRAIQAIGARVAVSVYQTAPTAACTRDMAGLQQENGRSIHVRDLGVRRPFDASLQYPQDSLL